MPRSRHPFLASSLGSGGRGVRSDRHRCTGLIAEFAGGRTVDAWRCRDAIEADAAEKSEQDAREDARQLANEGRPTPSIRLAAAGAPSAAQGAVARGQSPADQASAGTADPRLSVDAPPGLPLRAGLLQENSKGYKETWNGYKLHLDVACGRNQVSCVLTSASVHDSRVAIPLMTMTSARIAYLYDLMDAAYDAAVYDHAASYMDRSAIAFCTSMKRQRAAPASLISRAIGTRPHL